MGLNYYAVELAPPALERLLNDKSLQDKLGLCVHDFIERIIYQEEGLVRPEEDIYICQLEIIDVLHLDYKALVFFADDIEKYGNGDRFEDVVFGDHKLEILECYEPSWFSRSKLKRAFQILFAFCNDYDLGLFFKKAYERENIVVCFYD